MNELEATAVLVALFALRCIAPLAITLAAAYLMNRLVDRWRAEDELLLQMEGEVDKEAEPTPNLRLPVVTIPCWILKNCSEVRQAECISRKQPGIPCWLVRLRYEGRLSEKCSDCPAYAKSRVTAVIQ